jgi:hypothetical protein
MILWAQQAGRVDLGEAAQVLCLVQAGALGGTSWTIKARAQRRGIRILLAVVMTSPLTTFQVERLVSGKLLWPGKALLFLSRHDR